MGLPATPSAETRRLRAIVAIARAVNDAVIDERRFGDLVARTVATHVGDGATLWLYSLDNSSLVRVGAGHRDAISAMLLREGAASVLRGRGDAVVDAVLDSGAAAVLNQEEMGRHIAEFDPQLAPWLAVCGVSSVAVLPLGDGAWPCGVLIATRDAGRPPYTDDEFAFLQAIAETAASTVNTASLLTGSAAAVEELRRQATAFDQLSDVVVAWDNEGKVIGWNAAAERVYGYSAVEALGCDVLTLLDTHVIDSDSGHRSPAERNYPELLESLAGAGSMTLDLTQRRADGETVAVTRTLTGLADRQGRIIGVIAIDHDLGDRGPRERTALHDAVTGLPNARFLRDHLERVLISWAGGAGLAAALVIQLGDLNTLLKGLPTDVAGQLVKVLAGRLAASLRRGDVIARTGQDQFVVVAESVGDVANVERLAKRLVTAARQPLAAGGQTMLLHPAVGVSMLDDRQPVQITPDELIAQATDALPAARADPAHIAFTAADS